MINIESRKNRIKNVGFCEIICKCFYKNKKSFSHFNKTKHFIKEKLSMENMIKSFINFDILKRIILSENQLKLFNNIPKQKLKILKNLDRIKLDEKSKINNINENKRTKYDEVEMRIEEFYK